MVFRVVRPRHHGNGEVCNAEEERRGQTMHGTVGIEEKARNSGNKSIGGTGRCTDNSRIEKGHSSSSNTRGS